MPFPETDQVYVAITSFKYHDGSADVIVREGQTILGSKLTGAPEALFVALGSTPDEIVAAKRAAGVAGA